jgi:ribosome-associated translation inhibitor RaiA
MQIQINTDNHIDATANMIGNLQGLVTDKLQRFSSRLTRVELHLTDENSSSKGGDDDIRCVMEARINGMQPVSVTERSANVEQAVRGALDKMRARLDTTLGKLSNH